MMHESAFFDYQQGSNELHTDTSDPQAISIAANDSCMPGISCLDGLIIGLIKADQSGPRDRTVDFGYIFGKA